VSTAFPKALIVGLGKSGMSAARYLHARGWQLAATDSRADPPGSEEFRRRAPGAPLAMGEFASPLLAGATIAVASPGVSLREPIFREARRQGIDVVGDVELFTRAAAAPAVGITGTNGKSTVTTLLGQMAERAGLRVRVGGNLGTPALDLLGDPATQLYVLELSSYQLEAAPSLRLQAATVLNVTPDHMDRYADSAQYAAAKAAIFKRCGTAVVTDEDPWVRDMPTGRARRRTFAVTTPADYCIASHAGEDWLHGPEGPLLAQRELRIRGRHNAANALAALALGDACGLPRPAMLQTLRDFTGLPHRSVCVRERRGVAWVDDSKGTNVGATLAAVEGMPGPLLVIAGGDGKQQDFAPLAAAFRGKVRRVLLIGRDARQVAAALHGVCELEFCSSLENAVAAAAQSAVAGDSVLLSPACASLDMFRDYAHRGDVFADAVRRLPE